MTGWIFIVSLLFAGWYWLFRIKINLSLSSVAMGLLIVLHGPMYWLYTRYWIYGKSIFFGMYLASGRSDTVQKKAAVESQVLPIYDNLHRLIRDPNFSASLERLDLAMAILFLGLILGIYLTDRMLKSSSVDFQSKVKAWGKAPLRQIMNGQAKTWLLSFVLIGCSILLFHLYVSTDKFHIVYDYFVSNAGEFEKIAMRHTGGGFSYFYGLFLSTVAIFIAVYALAESRWRYSTLLWPTLVFILMVAFGKLAYLSKAPIVVYLAQLIIGFVLMSTLRLNKRLAGALIVSMSLAMVAMVFISNSNLSGIPSALAFLFYRLFMIPNESLVEYFIVFPNYLPHTLGLDNKILAFLLGADKLNESYWRVAETLKNTGGSTTTAMFIADAWAQFSWIGVIVFPLLLGSLLKLIDHVLIVKTGKSSASIAGLSLGHYGIFVAMCTSLLTAFLSGGLLLLLPLVIMFGGHWRLRHLSAKA